MGLGYYSTVEKMKMTSPDGAYDGIAKPIVEFGIMPDVLTTGLPREQLDVSFGNMTINPGSELTPTQSAKPPTVRWKGEKNKFYLLMMVDPDPPSRKTPFMKEMFSIKSFKYLICYLFMHWIYQYLYIKHACTDYIGW